MIDIARLLRVAADVLDPTPGARGPGGSPDPPPLELQDCLDPLEDWPDDEAACFDEDSDWRRWYDAHRDTAGVVPSAIVHAFLDDVREASILHSVAILEIARKWGFETPA